MSVYKRLIKKTYESEKIADYYGHLDFLLKPEQTILNEFKEKLKNMKMLDIGVGGGRTTYFFSNLVKEYTAIDFSKKMIDICKIRFPKLKDNFLVRDVRELYGLPDNYFDFILFSFNGIDCLFEHDQRMKAFYEIKRVCKKGGYFCFSAHNLLGIDKLLKIKPSSNPFKILKRKTKAFLIKILNEDFKKLKQKEYAVIMEIVHRSFLKTYYVKPLEQLRQLKEVGFTNVRLFSFEDGKEIKDVSLLNNLDELFVYYLCEVN